MKKSCSIMAAIYAIAAVFVGHLVYRRFPQIVPTIIGGVIGGGIVWMGLAYFAGIWTKLAEAFRLARSGEGEPPKDGETIAVVGTIEPVGSPLTSPLTGESVVAYKYEVREGERLLYDGFALAPSMVDSPHGRIRIFAQPDLQTKPRDVAGASLRFEDYVADTKWQEPELSLNKVLKHFNDRDGSVRTDTRMVRHDPDLTTATFKEWSFAPGDRVYATGRYSMERGGLVAEPGMPLSVSIRDASHGFAGRSVAGAFGNLIGALIFLGIAAAGLVALYAFVPLAASEQMAPNLRRTWREVRLERTIDRRVRPPLRKAGLIDSGIVSAMLEPGTARGRVVDGPYDFAVSRASASRLGDLTVIRIDDGAVTLTVEHGRPVRFRFAGSGDVDASTFARDLEVEITGSNRRSDVAGRVTYFRDDAESPACRVTFDAPISR